MTNNTLDLQGLYMARHPHDVIEIDQQTLASIENYAHKSYSLVTNRYGSKKIRWVEMDRYWAGEEGALAVSKKSYKEFLPGKYFTYKVLAEIIKESLSKTGISINGAKIAEMGCGSALWSLMLAQLGAKVYLFDKSWSALEYSEFLAKSFNVAPIEVRQGDFFREIPDQWDETFDAVIAGGVLEHFDIDKQDRYFSIVSKILKPGGITAFTTPNNYSPFNISSDIRRRRFYKRVGELSDLIYTINLPMPYSIEGGERNMDSMLEENGFEVIRETDAVMFAPSGPINREEIDDNEDTRAFYTKLERMCRRQFFNPNISELDRVESLIIFWDMIGKGLTREERKQIGRWLYAVGQKPRE